MKRVWRHIPAVMLLFLFWGMAISASRMDSVSSDELYHITAGYSYWRTGEFRLQPENGMLPQLFAGAPMALTDRRFDFNRYEGEWSASNVVTIGWRLFFISGHDPLSLLLQARMMCGLIGMALGAAIYGWSLRLFGYAGAMLSLTAYVFCPITLSHGVYATSDAMATLVFLLNTAAFWRLCRRPRWDRTLVAGLALSILTLTKFSFPIMAPVILCMALIHRPGWRILPHLVAAAATAWLAIWTMYGFRYAAVGPQESLFPGWAWVNSDSGPLINLINVCRRLELFPEAWLYGMAHTLHGSDRISYLMGEVSLGRWYYFPVAMAIKTPLALLIAAPLAWARLDRRAIPLILLAAVYFLIAALNGPYIGIRHLLPVYAAGFILLGAGAAWLIRGKARLVAAALILGLIAESASARPGYLAHFNPLIKKSQRFRWLADSNLDWGQDHFRLAVWIASHGGQPIYLSLFGYVKFNADGAFDLRKLPGVPRFEGISPQPLEPGYYCISANILVGAIGYQPYMDSNLIQLFEILRQRDPLEWVGDSIAVYQVTAEDLQKAGRRMIIQPTD